MASFEPTNLLSDISKGFLPFARLPRDSFTPIHPTTELNLGYLQGSLEGPTFFDTLRFNK